MVSLVFLAINLSFTLSILPVSMFSNNLSSWYWTVNKSDFYSGATRKCWRGAGCHVGAATAETDIQTGWSLVHQARGHHCRIQLKLQVC